MKRFFLGFLGGLLVCYIIFLVFINSAIKKQEERTEHYINSMPTMVELVHQEPEAVFYETEIVYEKTIVEEVDFDASEQEKVSLGEFKLTAYCSCEVCCGEYALNRPVDENGNTIVYTASGNRAVQGVTVAVDPSIIPFGTELEINGNRYIAHDCGGDIRENRIDVYFENHQDAWNFGTQYAEVFLCQ